MAAWWNVLLCMLLGFTFRKPHASWNFHNYTEGVTSFVPCEVAGMNDANAIIVHVWASCTWHLAKRSTCILNKPVNEEHFGWHAPTWTPCTRWDTIYGSLANFISILNVNVPVRCSITQLQSAHKLLLTPMVSFCNQNGTNETKVFI